MERYSNKSGCVFAPALGVLNPYEQGGFSAVDDIFVLESNRVKDKGKGNAIASDSKDRRWQV